MKDLKLNQLKNGRYLIGVSGGPDSMALLDMIRKENIHVEAAHVNYHRRESADQDEQTVRNYCREHQIPFHLLDSRPENYKGNFQACAREERYRFFAALCEERLLDGVLIAHQKDDLIETYLMQKQRKLGVNCYGLAEENMICGVKAIRPLLDWERKDVLDYCKDNGVPYDIDESNLSNAYTRNRIRHETVEKMSGSDKDEILKEIREMNARKEREEEAVDSFLEKPSHSVDEFLSFPYARNVVRRVFPLKSEVFIEETLRQISIGRNLLVKENGMVLVKEYGTVSVFRFPEPYSCTFHTMEELKDQDHTHFRIAGSGNGKQAATVKESDFPITIRSCRQGDAIRLRFGTKKIRRFFIDSKMPLRRRMVWPVVVNAEGDIILVPGIGCDVNHYSEKPNLFVIEY